MRRLRKRLPPGFTITAIDLLKEEGKTCSQQYISQQFNEPRDLRVIAVLTRIAEEHESHLGQLVSRIRKSAIAA
jgi:hypothetical protein